MNFVSIDVETANPDMASICQIGIAKFVDGALVDEWVSLVNPEDYFDDINVSIHGIDKRAVKGKPIFPEVIKNLRHFLEGSVCICHTHFDRVSIHRAFAKYNTQPFEITWLDSARVARRTWNEFAWKGYGLKNICEKIGYQFKHHDALEDAKAAGYVLLAALKESQLDIDAWRRRVTQPIDPKNSSRAKAIHRDGDPEGELFGEVIVFTGALAISRNEAADIAASIGCTVSSGVTSKTTLLIVGDQDISKLAGKAEQLIADGQAIRILKESDFKELVHHSQTITLPA